MSSRIVTIVIVLVLGYFLGVKFPGIAGRFGLA